jgi:hypothetical protein
LTTASFFLGLLQIISQGGDHPHSSSPGHAKNEVKLLAPAQIFSIDLRQGELIERSASGSVDAFLTFPVAPLPLRSIVRLYAPFEFLPVIISQSGRRQQRDHGSSDDERKHFTNHGISHFLFFSTRAGAGTIFRYRADEVQLIESEFMSFACK